MKTRMFVLGFQGKLLACVGLVILADILFYPGGLSGSIAGLYMLLVVGGVIAANARQWNAANGKLLAALAAGQSIAAILQPTSLGVMLFVLLCTAFALNLGERTRNPIMWLLDQLLLYLLQAPWGRLVRDGLTLKRLKHKRRKRGSTSLRSVYLPLGFGAAFLWLFTKANPVLDQWMSGIGWAWMADLLSLSRMAWWFIIWGVCWALLRPRWKFRIYRPSEKPSRIRQFFSSLEASLTVSLLIFNLLFLVQNIMDIAFLWSGATLPEGMSHAEYTHRGVYPLILTALLAGIFVLLALPPGGEGEKHTTTRRLLYFWVGQNIFLVISSIVRLLNYIEVYSLTYLRVAALLWVVLVACGLALILWRIYGRKTGEWLIRSNLLAAFALLYAFTFFDVGGMIAAYNVRHCAEVTGQGSMLDRGYLISEIGVEALPALQWYQQHASHSPSTLAAVAANDIPSLQWRLGEELSDWRRWTFRAALLSLSLPEEAPPQRISTEDGWQVEQPEAQP